MAKKAKRPWCGKRADTFEDIVPIWMVDIVHGAGLSVSIEMWDLLTRQLLRRVETDDPEYKVPVCDACNKWMSRLETPAKRALISMLRNKNAMLSEPLQTAVSNWAVMKALLWPHYSGRPDAVSRKWLDDFYHHRRYPTPTYVFAASLEQPTDLWTPTLNLSLRPSLPTGQPGDDQPAAYVFTFGVDYLVLQVLSIDDPDLSIKASDPSHIETAIPQLYPVIFERIAWPPTVALSRDDLYGLPFRFGAPSV